MIVNLTTSTVYTRTVDGEWFSRALSSSPSNPGTTRRPPRYRLETQGLSHSNAPYEGLEIYLLREGGKRVHLVAPALNFASLRVEDSRSGEVKLLYDLQIGEVASSVFQPPAGAEVTSVPGALDPLAAAKRAVQGTAKHPATPESGAATKK